VATAKELEEQRKREEEEQKEREAEKERKREDTKEAAAKAAYDKAIAWYQMDHNRWNHWAVFFLGSIASIFILHSHIKNEFPVWAASGVAAFVSFMWVCAGQSIRATSKAWRDVVKAIEGGDYRPAYEIWNDKIEIEGAIGKRFRDFGNTLALWRFGPNCDPTKTPWCSLTRLLVLMGFVSFFVFSAIAISSGLIVRVGLLLHQCGKFLMTHGG
jgi:hypothetical protein